MQRLGFSFSHWWWLVSNYDLSEKMKVTVSDFKEILCHFNKKLGSHNESCEQFFLLYVSCQGLNLDLYKTSIHEILRSSNSHTFNCLCLLIIEGFWEHGLLLIKCWLSLVHPFHSFILSPLIKSLVKTIMIQNIFLIFIDILIQFLWIQWSYVHALTKQYLRTTE